MPSMPLKPSSSIGLHYENELVDFMGQESGVVNNAAPTHSATSPQPDQIKGHKGILPQSLFMGKDLRASQLEEIVGAGYYACEGNSGLQQAHGQDGNQTHSINPYGIIEDHFQQKLDQNLSNNRSMNRDQSQNRIPMQVEDENYIYQRFKSFVKKQ